LSRMTKRTRAIWAKRIEEWRASGQQADEFAAGKGYEASTLRWAASRLRHEEAGPTPIVVPRAPAKRRRTAQPVAPPPSPAPPPRFLPVRMRAAAELVSGGVVVEVGSARIRVARGFDASLLGEVVRVLGEAAR